jgi:hypothetical protein
LETKTETLGKTFDLPILYVLRSVFFRFGTDFNRLFISFSFAAVCFTSLTLFKLSLIFFSAISDWLFGNAPAICGTVITGG